MTKKIALRLGTTVVAEGDVVKFDVIDKTRTVEASFQTLTFDEATKLATECLPQQKEINKTLKRLPINHVFVIGVYPNGKWIRVLVRVATDAYQNRTFYADK